MGGRIHFRKPCNRIYGRSIGCRRIRRRNRRRWREREPRGELHCDCRCDTCWCDIGGCHHGSREESRTRRNLNQHVRRASTYYDGKRNTSRGRRNITLHLHTWQHFCVWSFPCADIRTVHRHKRTTELFDLEHQRERRNCDNRRYREVIRLGWWFNRGDWNYNRCERFWCDIHTYHHNLCTIWKCRSGCDNATT